MVSKALVEQSVVLLICSLAYYNAPLIDYAQALTKASRLDQVFYTNSGAEAD